ncbi:hypothetical protein FIBSPDRAFT_1047833 [Athelia psychrophila]|uniref:Uncharacterized protein n=1 Tax=Athelia psychrophila TaxID=1759441 RepID=A0A166ELS7_9AGAM|nr:hypothetical protein FIBSPDRAFT_1047833 [Fibularhizoctonia sp. CBS 109695]
MASAPSIKPAPHSSLNTSLQRHSSSRYATQGNKHSMTLDDDDLHTGRRGNGEGEEDPSAAPPLPRTWLESVAHAVLFGGTGAHMGGPSAISPSASSQSPSQSHSQSRSPISRSRLDVLRQSQFSSTSALSDRTNVPRQIKSHPPPLLCAQVAAYRAPSDSRISPDWGLQVADRGRGKRSRGKPDPPRNQKDKGKPKGKDGMPTLTNTHAHDDEWGKTSGDDGIYTSGSSSEDDDDGELDLARLLVPSKRQNSIRSLRKHLHTPSSRQRLLALPYQRASGNGTRSSAGSMSRRGRGQGRARDDDGDEDWHSVAAGWDRDGAKAKVAGDLDEGIFFGGDGAAGPRKRTGIAGTWAQRNVEA